MRIQFSQTGGEPVTTVVGEPFDVPIIPSELGAQKLGSIKLRVTFDPQQFELVRERPGPIGGWKSIVNRLAAASGELVVGGMCLHGIGGGHPVHILTFKPLGPLTDAPISVAVVDAWTEMAARHEVSVEPLRVTAVEASIAP